MPDTEATRLYREELTVDPRDFALVRRTVTARIRSWGWHGLSGPVAGCVTELLTNVRHHAGSPRCVLTIRATAAELRITVSDRSPELPVVRQPDWDSERGRGLWLLVATVDDWGAVPTADGKDVWVSFTRPDGGDG
ncbi:ATP-binding protein [Streptomyces sp. JNUCC 64]